MKYKAIVAVDSNWAIGYENKLLFNVKKDMEHFKKLTSGKTVVMGRKTYESIRDMTPQDKPLLPGRKKIVLRSGDEDNILTTRVDYNGIVDTTVFTKCIDSIEAFCENDEEVWVIGGASIYEQLLDKCDEVYVTRFMKAAPKADTYFRNLSLDDKFILDDTIFIFNEEVSFAFEKYVNVNK